MYLFHVYGCSACMKVCELHVCLVPTEIRGRHWILLELELQTVVGCHVGSENQTQALCRSNKCFEQLSRLPDPKYVII